MNGHQLLLLLLALMFCPLPAQAQAQLKLSGRLVQGGLVHGQVAPGTRVLYHEHFVKLTADGRFILGFGRDAAPRQTLNLIASGGQVTSKQLRITQRSYRIERINGINREMMEPGAEDLKRIRADAELVAKARQRDSDLPYFEENFIWPVKGPITGVYGSQRILNGEPRRPHFGVDIAAPRGTPVVAPADGVVTLCHPEMFFSGATLIIDHGHGLTSSFLHLDKILVKPGDRVAQGQPIARVGASGRVTGPHLDWRINWFTIRLDPQLLFP